MYVTKLHFSNVSRTICLIHGFPGVTQKLSEHLPAEKYVKDAGFGFLHVPRTQFSFPVREDSRNRLFFTYFGFGLRLQLQHGLRLQLQHGLRLRFRLGLRLQLRLGLLLQQDLGLELDTDPTDFSI